MARNKIREHDAKKVLFEKLNLGKYNGILIDQDTDLNNLPPWITNAKLTVKPDQLFGKRKKLGLVLLDVNIKQVKEFIRKNMDKEVTIGKSTDKLTHFLVEPYIEHEKEYYLCIKSEREHDIIYFSEKGGINIEENWNKVTEFIIPTLTDIETIDLNIKEEKFIKSVYKLFIDFDFCYLELNPFTITDNQIHILDTVAQVDSCAHFKQKNQWNFPKPFGRKSYPEEKFIEKIDQHSGASLKLTILNPEGRIWNILSGGGASIIHLDTITNLGEGKELANYGEYSGNPSTEESYQYAKTILDLMTRISHPQGKKLIIGGAIANFTDVEKTFQGVVKALKEFQEKLREGNVSIYVRRGGPNWVKGLELIKKVGKELSLPMKIYGPNIGMVEKIPQFVEK